ncbi:MAG: hypothetical protein NC177_05305 [Ruminococcus flavefaciens]|nr:hypothetical protein [Ruminococcus flavefaciens]
MTEFSYKNVYNSDKHKKFMDSKRYVIADKFLYRTGNCKLSDGFSVEYRIYSDTYKEENYSSTKAVASEITLKNTERTVYEYCCFNSYAYGFNDIIHHKNGHRYYPFHVDMYGISFLDVDTLEVYNYIPEGYKHNDDRMCGESFLIYDVHYDRESDLIAYYGTYLGMVYDVMVGDFSCPLDFNPHLVSLYDILDYEYDEIDFKEWKDGRLYVSCGDEEKSVSIEELRKLIDELTERGL